MKKKEFFFVCDNCGHEFYSRKSTGTRRLIECSRCGELSAYLDEEPDDSDFEYENDHEDEFTDEFDISEEEFDDEFNDSEDDENIEYQEYDY